jgi:hypothetical protein
MDISGERDYTTQLVKQNVCYFTSNIGFPNSLIDV